MVHPETQPDPTKMANQPALQSSTGTIWLVVGAFLLAVSFVPLGALIFITRGPSGPLASILAIAITLLYLIMVMLRIWITGRATRLRWMAATLITMAATSVFGLLGCMAIERGASLSL